ncbi:MAG: heavy metal translocating P-type ATPase [Ignisphaera sp.]
MAKAIERFRIIGIDCPSCIYAIERKIYGLNGVQSFKIDSVSGEAVVEYDESIVTHEIVKAIRDAGYDVEKQQLLLVLDIESEEALSIEERLKQLRGVIDCRVSGITGTARILYNPYTVSVDQIKDFIKNLGIEFRDAVTAREYGMEESRDIVLRMLSFILGLASVVYHSLGVLGLEPPLWSYREYILLVAASAIMLLNKDTILKGFKSLLRFTPTMESLISLSATSTYIFSVAVMSRALGQGETFFEASAGILGFVSFGKYLEARLRERALKSIEGLAESLKCRTKVIRDGRIEEVDVENIFVGDIVEVRAGEMVCIDGVVIDGWGYVDESTFTGESLPRFKSAEKRDSVLAGSKLVSGYMKIRATRVGKETMISSIIETVREAQFTKPRVQIIADRIVGLLTWLIIFLSIATALYWSLIVGDFSRAVTFSASVLAVACPCPLGIAIPMVVAIAAYKATRIGILIRRGDFFERLLMVSTVVVDKTGTLTYGKPRVEGVKVWNSVSEESVMSLVCSAESRSEHPLASAILNYCSEKGYGYRAPESYDHIPGMGIVARVDGVRIIIGSEKLMESMGIELTDSIKSYADWGRGEGYTTVFVAMEGSIAAVILIRDTIREDAEDIIAFLKRKRGTRIIMATGDNITTARAVAKQLNIDEVYAELTPEDKMELIERLQKDGEKVAFIGDGINDAVAISRAFLGIAMGRGTDIAKEAGDIIIVSDNLSTIRKLYSLSEKVKKKAVENLIWAFVYNIMLVPIAMGMLYNSFGVLLRPEYAALAMILSDISVIINSTTLLKWRE